MLVFPVRDPMAKRFRYSEPGTLPRPGPVGRAVRFVLGVLCLFLVAEILTAASPFFSGRALTESSVWVVALIGLYVFPDVVDIGFGRAWKPLYLRGSLVAGAAAAALASWTMYGSAFAPPLGTFASTWLLYTFSHLGISFLLATFLATPGCEMRSIPQLWALISGRTVSEHYCPGVLTPIDRWEAKLRLGGQGN